MGSPVLNGLLMTKINISIVAVPERRDLAYALRDSLDTPNVSICFDVMRQGSWYNTRRSWLDFPSGTTHQISLEEDVIVCKDFVKTSSLLAERYSERIISFYSSKGDIALVERAKKNGCSWYIKDSVPSGQGVMMPVSLVYRFIAWADKYIDSSIAIHEDENLWGFLQTEKLKSFFCVPNLINHVGEMRSALGWNAHGKNSPYFIGDDVSGMDIEWDANTHLIQDYHQPYKNTRCIEAFKGTIKHQNDGEEYLWLKSV